MDKSGLVFSYSDSDTPSYVVTPNSKNLEGETHPVPRRFLVQIAIGPEVPQIYSHRLLPEVILSEKTDPFPISALPIPLQEPTGMRATTVSGHFPEFSFPSLFSLNAVPPDENAFAPS